jgi:lysophospholipid acyltransferase (LPLAT)-like uncharacterized protein
MEQKTSTTAAPRKARTRRRPTAIKSVWVAVRRPLAQSRWLKDALASLFAAGMRFVRLTNPLVAGSADPQSYVGLPPGIVALWHGQHLLTPAFYPRGVRLSAMFSRSNDAELNARVFEKLGFEAVRGSGGRDPASHLDKGGARALITLKRILDRGNHVAMIADVAKASPREAGLGIVTLAKLSGRAIHPVAVATSRRKVIQKSWDKTTINLPFGRSALVIGRPITVPRDAGDALLEEKRRAVTDELNRVTAEAYRLVDGPR